MTDGGLATLAEALAAAEAELAQASADDAQGGLPPPQAEAEGAGEQASTTGTEQTSTGTVDSLLSELGSPEPTPALDPSNPDFWKTEVEVTTDDGTKRMTLAEMRQGAMMRADYTRKTQELARERAIVSEAVDFHKAFKENPMGFASYLAAKAGLIAEGAEAPTGNMQVFTEAEVEARVQERLATALQEHPDVVAARNAAAVNAVDQVFAALEGRYQSTISPENRLLVLQEAQKRGTTDIELVFDSMLLRASQLASQRNAAKKVATTSASGTGGGNPATTPQVTDLKSAFELALKELSG